MQIFLASSSFLLLNWCFNLIIVFLNYSLASFPSQPLAQRLFSSQCRSPCPTPPPAPTNLSYPLNRRHKQIIYIIIFDGLSCSSPVCLTMSRSCFSVWFYCSLKYVCTRPCTCSLRSDPAPHLRLNSQLLCQPLYL